MRRFLLVLALAVPGRGRSRVRLPAARATARLGRRATTWPSSATRRSPSTSSTARSSCARRPPQVAKAEAARRSARKDYHDTQVVQPIVDRLVPNAQVENIASELGVKVTRRRHPEGARRRRSSSSTAASQAKYQDDIEEVRADGRRGRGVPDPPLAAAEEDPGEADEQIEDHRRRTSRSTTTRTRRSYSTPDSREVEFMLVGSRDDAIAARAGAAQTARTGRRWRRSTRSRPARRSTGGDVHRHQGPGRSRTNFGKAVFGDLATGDAVRR